MARHAILGACAALLCVSPPSMRAAGGLRVDPPQIVLAGPGATQRLIATAADGAAERDISGACSWASADSRIATADAALVKAQAPGRTVITAQCEGLTASFPVEVRSGGDSAMQVRFATDIVSILTIKGCNSSGCHGSPAGQNGFKLSLYGADPSADYRAIVEDSDGKRVALDEPAKSLILQKPTFQIAHGGGHLMTPESDSYGTILHWLEQGAPHSPAGATLTKLEIYPQERILVGEGTRQPIVVVGRLSDGTIADMTDRVRYQVNDEAIVTSVENGAVTAKGRGRTTALARAMGKTAAAELIVIDAAAGADYPSTPPASFIDQRIFSKLRQVNIRPRPSASDSIFVRRVYLDLIGMLPTVDEVSRFVHDARGDKRSRLIDELLEREDYARHWQVKLEDWFRNSQYYSQGRTNGSYKRWLHDLLADDKPYDQAVHEMLTAVGDTTVRPAGNFWHPAIDFMLKEFEINKATPTVTRLFLGKRIECAECHNHPLENLTQDDFYGMAAFLAQTRVKHGYGQYRRVWYDARQGEIDHPATKEPVAPKFLDGPVATIPPGKTRREVLADWIVNDQRMQFARATVNRVWFEYFGRGIVEPFDDFRSTNRPTHPELLDQLARHFIDSDFRFKALHRLILSSRTYQLSAHDPQRAGGEDPLEEILFARYVPRKIPAEVLLDAVVQVTETPHEFRNYPAGASAKDLIASIGAPYFLTTFGHPRRDVMEPRSGAPSMSQALHLMNGEAIGEKVQAEDNVLGRLLGAGKSDGEIIEELYLRAYARQPLDDESAQLQSYVRAELAAGRSRRQALEGVLWAVLNSKEFQLNR